jgi:hypothetical protein
MLSRKKIAFIGTSSLLALTLLFKLFKQDSCQEIAVRVDDALLKGDINVVWRYIPDTEKQSLGVTKKDFQTIVSRYYLPVFAAYGHATGRKVTPYQPIAGAYSATRTYFRPDRTEVRTGVIVAPADNGPMCYGLISGLVTSAMIAKYRNPSDKFTYFWEQKALTKDSEQLSKLGLKGLIYMDQGERVVSTWEQRLTVVNQKLDVLCGEHREAQDQDAR